MKKTMLTLLLVAAATLPVAALAGQGHAQGQEAQGHAHPDEASPWGKPGKPERVSRTITIDMSDAMRFSPARLTVNAGQTVRFVVVNKGKLGHELVIGDMAGLKAHAEAMRKHPEMEHADEDGIEVGPGKRGQLVWEFGQPGDFHFACLLPGHFEAGMVGKLTVRARPGP